MNLTLKKLIVFVTLLFLGLSSYTQNKGDVPEPDLMPPPPPGLPIDNGVLIILILGLIYGAKKVIDLNKAKKLN